MGAIKAINDHYGCNQHLHCEAPKCSQEEPLKRNKEGCGNQPQSHTAALPTNATRASWGCHEYHNDTNPATMNIAARKSIAAKRVQQMQTATFCQPAQESKVVRSTQRWQLLSPSAWPMQAAQAPQERGSRRQQVQQQEESPWAQGQGLQPLMPTRGARQSLTQRVLR